MTTSRGVINKPTEGELLRILQGSDDSDGALGVVEMVLAPGSAGPPLHAHPTHGEGFYVLAGDLTFQLGEEIVTGGPGTWAFAPTNTPHTLANLSAHQGRLLCVFTPAGFERRFERILAEQAGTSPPTELSDAGQQNRILGPALSG